MKFMILKNIVKMKMSNAIVIAKRMISSVWMKAIAIVVSVWKKMRLTLKLTVLKLDSNGILKHIQAEKDDKIVQTLNWQRLKLKVV